MTRIRVRVRVSVFIRVRVTPMSTVERTSPSAQQCHITKAGARAKATVEAMPRSGSNATDTRRVGG